MSFDALHCSRFCVLVSFSGSRRTDQQQLHPQPKELLIESRWLCGWLLQSLVALFSLLDQATLKNHSKSSLLCCTWLSCLGGYWCSRQGQFCHSQCQRFQQMQWKTHCPIQLHCRCWQQGVLLESNSSRNRIDWRRLLCFLEVRWTRNLPWSS